jgi:hypothetical protein
MVRVYLDLHKADEVLEDEEGSEFEDLAAAKAEAEKSLHELVGRDIASETPLEQRSFVLRDEHRNVIATVQIKAAVRMVQETRN